MELKENEIVCSACAVKYFRVEYQDKYVVIEQNRTRRRVPRGYYFDDTGQYIYVSLFYADIFQHKKRIKRFVLNKETKEWKDYETNFLERHKPLKRLPTDNNEIKDLRK